MYCWKCTLYTRHAPGSVAGTSYPYYLRESSPWRRDINLHFTSDESFMATELHSGDLNTLLSDSKVHTLFLTPQCPSLEAPEVWAWWKHYARTNLSRYRCGQLSGTATLTLWIRAATEDTAVPILNYDQEPLMAPVLLLLHLGSISPCMFCGRNGVYIKQRTSELLLPMHFVFNVAFLRDVMQEHSPI